MQLVTPKLTQGTKTDDPIINYRLTYAPQSPSLSAIRSPKGAKLRHDRISKIDAVY